jgi:hypothetical protein
MNLREIINGWNHLGSVNQIGFIIGLVGTIATVLGLAGIRMHLANLIIFIFFCGFCMLFYGNVQQSRKLAKAEEMLGTVDTQIDHATQAVYTQKNEEIEQKKEMIRKLEIDVATWKDHAASWQDKATSWKSDVETLVKEGEWARDLICSRGLQKEPSLEPGKERKTEGLPMAYSARLGTPEGKRLSEFDIKLHRISRSIDN